MIPGNNTTSKSPRAPPSPDYDLPDYDLPDYDLPDYDLPDYDLPDYTFVGV